ncbi:MAG: L-lysine 6-transaminase [Acidobacteriota bacterium]|nr:L-lysine 6-transaminase [Acidobacteriota bacterium]MDH3524899.1 L-lysine 6-transaminase [Acidobacteriota bacterium]
MTTTVSRSARIAPQEVHASLRRHILADGLPIILDLERSSGAYLYDSLRGRRLLDLFGCFSTCTLGYNHPALTDPEFQARLLPAAVNKPSNSDLYSPEMAEFVEALARTVPEPLGRRMFFIEGGALAVENAVKAAMDWKVRKNLAAGKGEKGHQIIHFREAFHGRSGYTLSLTNTDPVKTRYFAKFDWPRITNPKLRFPVTDEVLDEVVAAERRAIGEIEQALVDHRDDVAGLIIEPIQGEGGDNHFRPEFLRALRELADEGDFLLLFDEIQTGFGTTGAWWCFEHFGVQPDIFAFGKKTQVCGICAGPRLDEVESVFQVAGRINSTWGGNLVDMIRCRRYVEVIEDDGLVDNAARVGAELLAGLRRLEQRYPDRISNSRGRGLFVAFDLADQEARRRTLLAMLEAGVLGLRSGARSLRFRPALTLTAEEAAEGLARLESALTAGSA